MYHLFKPDSTNSPLFVGPESTKSAAGSGLEDVGAVFPISQTLKLDFTDEREQIRESNQYKS